MRDLDAPDNDPPTSRPAAAAALLEHRVTRLETWRDAHATEFSAVKDDLWTLRQDVTVIRDRQGWLIAAAVLVLTAVVSGTGYVTTRIVLASLDTAAQTTQEERLEAIADVIEQGGLPRTKSGEPALAALQQALPRVRGISRSERAAACMRAETRAPYACRPRGDQAP